MTNHGDDCYFFYYSTCSKGDSCPFRHCEAAIGNETVCNLWQEGRCYRASCKFRHMEITHNRKEIACYWENQSAGCQKPHCAFFHEKPRYIDGLYVPSDKSIKKTDEGLQEEPAPPQTALPTAANPQLRGVIKSEAQEPVPSPTHPPVVINPADDDEDEDDQFSEEGDVGVSPRKQLGGPKLDDALNFGVSTLEEIRLRRALKASMKKALYCFPGNDTSTNGEKENIQSFYRPVRDGVDDRSGNGVPLKRRLAERLGRVVEEEQPSVPSHKSSKSVKERLTLPREPIVPRQSDETSTRSKKPEQIRIKTLEEIKQEKAAKSKHPKDNTASEITINKSITTKSPKGVKRAITVKDDTIGNVKTFSEILHAKKKKQEANQEDMKEKITDKCRDKTDPPGSQENECVGEIRVKTLEEIRREKAARLQAEQTQVLQNTSDPQESRAKKARLLHLKKTASQGKETSASEKSENVTEKHLTPAPTEAPASTNSIKVKTFEEIMREKRLRKQETEEQSSSSCQAKNSEIEPPVQLSTGPVMRRKVPAKITCTADSSLPSTTSEALKTTAISAAVLSDTSLPSKKNETEVHSHRPSSRDYMERESNIQKTPDLVAETKVRPKLNVKPSVVKPAVHLKLGQKRKALELSAVAAIKPLNSSSMETGCDTDSQVFPLTSQDSLNSHILCNPITSSENLQTNPVFSKTSIKEPQAPETVPQSHTQKTPTQTKSRRSSVTASRSTLSSTASTSAVDEFEDLISEFTTDDHLHEDVDPTLGEDDLLQELSEMIDS